MDAIMVVQDWPSQITKLLHLKTATSRVDVGRLWKYFAPRQAATEGELIRAEVAIGHHLDASYRRFLGHANGWPGFFQNVDLFGTEELCSRALMQEVHELLKESVPADSERSQLLPIGAASPGTDVFVICRPDSPTAGMVVWLAGYEIERFAGFDEFFLAMMECNRREYESLRKPRAVQE